MWKIVFIQMAAKMVLVLGFDHMNTGVMAAREIPPQMANFQTFYRAAFYFFLAAETVHFAHCYFVLNFTLSAQKQHILVFRNTTNCSSVHSGMTGTSLAELALHNRYV